MKTTRQIREERAGLHQEMEAIAKAPKGENGSLDAEQRTKFDQLSAKDDELAAEALRSVKVENLAKEKAEQRAEELDKEPGADPGKVREYRTVFKEYLKGGITNMDADARQILQKGEVRGTSNQVVGTTTLGGFLLPKTMGDQLFIALKTAGGVASVANVINTDSGEDLLYPNMDDTGTSAVLVAEAASAGVQDITFAQTTLSAYNMGTGRVMVSRQLLQDSAFDVETWVNTAFEGRFTRGINAYATSGTGSSQPQGVVTASGLGKTAAAVAAITAAELMDLEHSVDREYRKLGSSFMMHDSTMRALKQLSLGAGDSTPLWLPSLRDGEPDTLLGYPIVINNDMDTLATAKKVVLFGYFNSFIIRQVNGVFMQRLDERYAEQFLVAFLAWQRVDAKYIGPSSDKCFKHLITA
jgi:HK97 family phage major capsid protein